MSLYHYLVRLETVLHSRQDIDVELLQIDVVTILSTVIKEHFDCDRIRQYSETNTPENTYFAKCWPIFTLFFSVKRHISTQPRI